MLFDPYRSHYRNDGRRMRAIALRHFRAMSGDCDETRASFVSRLVFRSCSGIDVVFRSCSGIDAKQDFEYCVI